MDSKLRSIVESRSGGYCEYCRVPEQYDRLPFQVDHIIAEKHGGLSIAENLAWSCYDCNMYKGPNIASIDPNSDEVTRLFHPRSHAWAEHFKPQQGVLLGLTAEGRATIRCLRINLGRRVVFRRELIDEGLLELG